MSCIICYKLAASFFLLSLKAVLTETTWLLSFLFEPTQSAALQTEELLDKLSISLTGVELKVIERLYHQALKLQIEYFFAQPLVQRTIVPLSRLWDPAENRIVVFSDFDLTCTVVDSCAILAEIAILTAPKSEQNGPENLIARKSSADLRNSWDVLFRQYAEEHEQCIKSIMPSEPGNYAELHFLFTIFRQPMTGY